MAAHRDMDCGQQAHSMGEVAPVFSNGDVISTSSLDSDQSPEIVGWGPHDDVDRNPGYIGQSSEQLHGEEEGSDDSDCSMSKRIKDRPSDRSDDATPRFACPFYRSDPDAHKDCGNFNLSRIRDLKQHLQRRHYTPPCQCPICFKKFSSDQQRDDHIRSQLCQLQKPTAAEKKPKVVSEKAQALLRRKVDRTLSPEDQWYAVYHIIFGEDAPRPARPFLGDVVEETMGMLRDFFTAQGSEIIPRFLEARSRHAAVEDPLKLDSLLVELFNEVTDQFDRKIRCKGGADGPNPTSAQPEPPPCSAAKPPIPNITSATPRFSLKARSQIWGKTSSVSSSSSDASCSALDASRLRFHTPLAAPDSGVEDNRFQLQWQMLGQNQGLGIDMISDLSDPNAVQNHIFHLQIQLSQYREKAAQLHQQLLVQKTELPDAQPLPFGFPDQFSDSPQWPLTYEPPMQSAGYQTQTMDQMGNLNWHPWVTENFEGADDWENHEV
ncbi:hypothetical protein B0T26DRAFT_788181 [Lasiosphaeria miniovina]|uniref:C2H2-type domain-containing protein n=1 Tax=Lasiosphaeria miniovina TaxID=1954250 RepID=A0AA39ZYF6_9PEZI|nr:uncharacterized protein B0T26DRAFT_788181 [Lasiosphaeria miniovina]KAK0705958.1 hypothetical protein B0T26DRAFT_788181 [Lasiosphaeria miniovina]